MMIQAISRFRVLNEAEAASVAEALCGHPHLAERIQGFLGKETYRDLHDPALFYLLTRWSDVLSYRTCHARDEHTQSQEGIPKGIELDPNYTRLEVLERLDEGASEAAGAEAAPLFASFFASSQSIFFLQLDLESLVLAHNPAVSRWLGRAVLGERLHSLLDEQGRASWDERLQSGRYGQPFRLNVYAHSGRVHTWLCDLDRQGDRVLLLAEVEVSPEQWEQMHIIQQDTMRMTREQVRKNRGQIREFEQFKASHWHLARLQEYMTMCLACGHVQVQPGKWCELTRYLRDNDLWFSHGYCPDCATKVMAEIGDNEPALPPSP